MSSTRSGRHGTRAIAAGIFVLLLAALASLAVACSAEPQYKRIQLTTPGQTQAAPSPQTPRAPLRVAVAGVVSPKETFKTYQDLLQYLGTRLDRPVELIQRGTYAEINDLIRAGDIDLAFVCTLAYVQGAQDFGMEIIAVPEVRGEPLYRAYLIVPAESEVATLDELQGKVFAFTDPDSNTGRLYPTYLLWQKGESPEGFFRKVVYTYSHDNSINAVAGKLVDGASVDSLVYDYAIARDPELAERTRIIVRSEPFGAPPVVVHPALAADLKEQLQEILLEMHTDERGRVILDGLMIDRFVIADQAAYDPVREMARELRGRR